jgi:hypothetical protein
MLIIEAKSKLRSDPSSYLENSIAGASLPHIGVNSHLRTSRLTDWLRPLQALERHHAAEVTK